VGLRVKKTISKNQAHVRFNDVLGINQSSGKALNCTSKVLRYWR